MQRIDEAEIWRALEDAAFGNGVIPAPPPPTHGPRGRAGFQVLVPVTLVFSLVGGVMFYLGVTQSRTNAAEQELLAQQWQALATERHQWSEKREEDEKERVQMRQLQVERVKRAIQSGSTFDASLVLLNLADEIERFQLDDEESLIIFRQTMEQLFQEAREQSTTGETKP